MFCNQEEQQFAGANDYPLHSQLSGKVYLSENPLSTFRLVPKELNKYKKRITPYMLTQIVSKLTFLIEKKKKLRFGQMTSAPEMYGCIINIA